MSNADFDTLQYAKRLQDVGVPPEVAEMHAALAAELMQKAVTAATAASVATCDAEHSRLEGKIDVLAERLTNLAARFDAFAKHMDERFAAFAKMMDERFTAMDKSIDDRIEKSIGKLRADLMRWNLALVIGAGSVIGVIIKFF